MVDEPETDEAQLGGSLADVRAYCAVVDFGTISAAARHLQETKGGVSRRVARLERRLGVTLLARTSRAVSPTEEGGAFYAKAREALALLDDALEGARQARALPAGRLRVTAPVDFGVDVLPELVVRFRELHPQITVDLLLTDAPLDLAAHRVDLALRAMPGDLPDMGYRAVALADFDISLWAAPAYLAAHPAPGVPDDLAAHALLDARDMSGGGQLTLRERRGREVQVGARPHVRSSDYASLHRLALAGGGIAPLPDIVAARSAVAGALRRVLPGWSAGSARLHAVSLAGRPAPARVRVFREFVREELTTLLARAAAAG